MTMLGQPKRRRHIPVLHPVGSPHSGGEGSHRQSYHDEPSRPEPHVKRGAADARGEAHRPWTGSRSLEGPSAWRD